jgi:diacylglycerol kinase (ATP)
MWLQMGAHGDCIAQASKIRIVTDAPLHMQVDGEPCILQPSEIVIDLKNKASMIAAVDEVVSPSCVQAACSC